MKLYRKNAVIAVIAMGFLMLATSATAATSGNGVNSTLMAMESPAEDMLDAIDSQNIPALRTLYHQLELSMLSLNQHHAGDANQGKNIAMQNAWFDLISLEIKEADDLPALANAINQFSGQLIITTDFQYPYQKDIAWMDYLGRELLLLNKYSSVSSFHGSLLKVRQQALQAAWKSVQEAVGKSKEGLLLIRTVNPTIQALVTENTPEKMVTLSNRELELVDDIEKYFHID